MSNLVNSFPTDLKYAFWNQRLNDNFTGPVWEIAKDDGAGGFITQEIEFLANGQLDNSAIETFAGGAEIRLKKWYRQDGGTGNNALEWNLYENLPPILFNEDFGRYFVEFNRGRGMGLEIVDAEDRGHTTSFFMIRRQVLAGGFHYVFDAQSGPNRLAADFSSSTTIRVTGTHTDGPDIEMPEPQEWGVYTTHLKRGGGDELTETISKFKKDGTQFGDDFYVRGSPGSGISLGNRAPDNTAGGANFQIEGIVFYYNYIPDSDVNAIESELMSVVDPLSIKGTVVKDGSGVEGVAVAYIQADDEQFTNATVLGADVTNALGDHEYDGEYDNTKLIGASFSYPDPVDPAKRKGAFRWMNLNLVLA